MDRNEDGARILVCQVSLENPYRMSAVEYVDFVDRVTETDDVEAVAALRRQLEAAGHDGIVIDAWRESDPLPASGLVPWAEYAANIYVAFDPGEVAIVDVLEPEQVFGLPIAPAFW